MSRRPGSTSSSTGPSSSAPTAWCGCASSTAARSTSPVLKFLSEAEQIGIVDTLGAEPGDLLLRRRRARAGSSTTCSARCASSSAARRCTRAACSSCGSSTSRCSRRSTTTGSPIPAHHPFTMPHPDDLESSRTAKGEDLLAVRSQAYDLVLNGWELGSGSVRIHRPDIQQQIFSLLGIADEEAQAALRLPARRLPLRRPAARRLRLRHRPPRRDPRGRGEHPRGDRLPEDPVGRRPAHRRAHRRSTRPSSRSSASRSCPGRRSRREAPRPRAVVQGGGDYGRGGAIVRARVGRPLTSRSWLLQDEVELVVPGRL